MASRRAFLSLVLAALLLVAQHAAVTHAIWHAQAGLPGHAQGTLSGANAGQSDDKRAPQAQLCAFDAALGQVLGAASGHAATFVATRIDTESARAPDRTCRHIAAVPPQSRSPPLVLL